MSAPRSTWPDQRSPHQIANDIRRVMTAVMVNSGRMSAAHRTEVGELANAIDALEDTTVADELERMVIGLHEQAHGQHPIRVCTLAPCAGSNLDLFRGPAEWATL